MKHDERRVLEDWERDDIFRKSIAARKDGTPFVFFEGPPTANGMPHIGHAMTRVFKDVVLRYKTMQGFHVPRRAGWDTQGLPVEIGVEKSLGLKTKKDIEEYGIAPFNKACKESVWKYRDEWVKFSERLGFWIDYSEAYVTYENTYLESLWSVIKRVWDRDLLYEDHKIVPWCPRCGTGLSSHELAQGYKEVKDISVYVKFILKNGQRIGDWGVPARTFVVAWTTTPWTLPGNVALAVHKDSTYVILSHDGEFLIFEKSRSEALEVEGEMVTECTGADLEGLMYEPLFAIPETQNEQSHKIYSADFVTTTDGTGIVHTAVMYGEDDYVLGKAVGLPTVHTVDEAGKFISAVTPFAGRYVKDEETEREIIGTIKANGQLFKSQKFSHDYPFCWRCDSHVLYYGRKSWWIAMSKLRNDLLARNETVNWVPEHLRDGRFGEWLREVKDWAFSRARYWGTPLPIWRCAGCAETDVIGSVAELQERMLPTKNRYILMRHGEAEQNVANVISSDITTDNYKLTEKGKAQTIAACERLAKAEDNIDLIVASDFPRTKETAMLLSGCKNNLKVVCDERLREYNVGVFSGKQVDEFSHAFPRERRFREAPEGGETLIAIRQRMLAVVDELEQQHEGKTIVIISHATPLWCLKMAMLGANVDESLAAIEAPDEHHGAYFPNGDVQELTRTRMPVDDETFLDLHRPFIDQIEFSCKKCSGTMQRVPELADVWFDSGAMPYAQWHYPMEHKEKIDNEGAYPADYIVEAVDQTRGWFYTLLAVATLLEKDAPYKNVISLGHVLDEEGKKLSKSKGNYVDPSELIEKYGADPVRWYFLTVNQPGEPKLFSEKDVITAKRNTLDLLWNSFVFWETYGNKEDREISTEHVLDRWVLERLHEVTKQVTEMLDGYDLVSAGRALEQFIAEDLSRWYIRRSRSRLKDGGSGTLREVLLTISTLMAPFAPFLADSIYRGVDGEKESVHLEDWPSVGIMERLKTFAQGTLTDEMQRLRDVVSQILDARRKEQIKVRQPLASVTIQGKEFSEALTEILLDEVNIKNAVFIEEDQNQPVIVLDTTVTPELEREGAMRDLIREIQQVRKTAGCTPDDVVRVRAPKRDGLDMFDEIIRKEVRASAIDWVEEGEVEIV